MPFNSIIDKNNEWWNAHISVLRKWYFAIEFICTSSKRRRWEKGWNMGMMLRYNQFGYSRRESRYIMSRHGRNGVKRRSDKKRSERVGKHQQQKDSIRRSKWNTFQFWTSTELCFLSSVYSARSHYPLAEDRENWEWISIGFLLLNALQTARLWRHYSLTKRSAKLAHWSSEPIFSKNKNIVLVLSCTQNVSCVPVRQTKLLTQKSVNMNNGIRVCCRGAGKQSCSPRRQGAWSAHEHQRRKG